ncbi:hypothetical protein FVEG_01698 [Fusarium verticillioides 7600]|uniref:Uncharacterized protein n=1 Tax=Gibberella moniliformis (strain M3125 / FGSC 7600) TaxID=334819 RepID=W7M0Q9_GIBM7|nr:hypothetical protein FVEG_01698 [Fusarium verticillioides 7600]EWG38497.1 hypothetical protein FVEG_01698 [Fusarium verticillioides 7600]
MGGSANHARAQMEDIFPTRGILFPTGGRLNSLRDALRSFDGAAYVLIQRAQNFIDLLRAEGPFSQDDAESICSVQARAIEIVQVARLVHDAAIQDIVRQVVSFGDKASFNVDALLEHFKKPLERVVQEIILEAHSDDILWKIAEECYHQATRPSGNLNPENFLATIAPLQQEQEKENWVKFWIQLLCNCPDASVFRQHDKANNHRIDIFSINYQEASGMLHHHLDRGLSSPWETDNLVSWSSSLIFAIQYANWRFCNPPRFSRPMDIRICAVDTSKFPRGQFARDKWLLKCFKNTEFSDQENSFRELRLNEDHDNGEYLSQGVLHIEDRSDTLSLRSLENAGLWNLYPEFGISVVERGGGETDVRKLWTDYDKALRWQWQFKKKTTKADVHIALHIAEECFSSFDQDDLALLLLCFRERKLHPEKPSFQGPFADLLSPVSAEGIVYEETIEVDRYLTLRKRLSKLSQVSGERGLKLFEQLYVLEDADED